MDERNGTSTTAPRRDRKRFQAEERNLQKLFDRLPPHSLEAEMSLLGSMILDHSVIGDVIEIVPLASSPATSCSSRRR